MHGLSQNRWILFLEFVVKQTSLTTTTGEKLKFHQCIKLVAMVAGLCNQKRFLQIFELI